MGLENERYVKLDLTFGEKIKLFLFGLIKESRLPVREVVREVRVSAPAPAYTGVPAPASAPAREINTDEEKLVIPFFNFDQDVKSNF